MILQGNIIKRTKRKGGIVLKLHDVGNNHHSRLFVETEKDNDSSLSLFCFVGAVIRAHGCVCIKDNNDEHHRIDNESGDVLLYLVQDNLILLKCSPDPKSVELVLQALIQGDTRVSVASLGNTAMLWEEAFCIHQLRNNRKRRIEIAKIVRHLNSSISSSGMENHKEHVEMEQRKPRNRKPKLKKADIELLDQLVTQGSASSSSRLTPNPLDNSWKLYELVEEECKTILNVSDDKNNKHQLLNLPSQDDTLLSSRGNLKRSDYIHGKKHPQVEWMVSRIKRMGLSPRHILDVGGGRGDLATKCALAFPNAIVTVVDKNAASLEAGKEYSSLLHGISQRMSFLNADFFRYMKDTAFYLPPNHPPVDLVVALHACGDLSDLALDFAQKRNVSFVICPCCYNKRLVPEYGPPWHKLLGDKLSHTQRIAESEIRTESLRAMTIINSLRLHSYYGAELSDTRPNLSMDTFSATYSLRNVVLVGGSQASII